MTRRIKIETLRRDPDWTDDPTLIGYRRPITHRQASAIINANVDDCKEEHNGRSGWYLVRTADSSLMLACYPHGDTYLATEAYRGTL
jgi:hypothetical protein